MIAFVFTCLFKSAGKVEYTTCVILRILCLFSSTIVERPVLILFYYKVGDVVLSVKTMELCLVDFFN